MDAENQKATAFVSRLLANPTLSGLSPLQKEEQILQFLLKNARQLYPTLSSPNFFPDMNWEQIWSLLCQALYREIDNSMLPNLKSILTEKIDLSFIPFLRQQNLPHDQIKDEIYKFLEKLLEKPEARRAFTGPFSALLFNIHERYVDQVFQRKEYVHFELVKVQRLKMSKEELKNMISTSILLSPSIHILSAGTGPGQQDTATGVVQRQFADKVFQSLQKTIGSLPDEVLRSAVNSNVSFVENKNIGATARISSIFSARCRNYNPMQKIDRGADTADKSWLSIARRNYKFYGFDVKILDEFYKIAAENGW